MNCKRCNSTKLVKHGMSRGKQRWLCKDCGYKQVSEPMPVGRPQNRILTTIALIVGVTNLSKMGFLKQDCNIGSANLVDTEVPEIDKKKIDILF